MINGASQVGDNRPCGYMAGQRGIVTSARLNMTIAEELDYCVESRVIAIKHGFTTA